MSDWRESLKQLRQSFQPLADRGGELRHVLIETSVEFGKYHPDDFYPPFLLSQARPGGPWRLNVPSENDEGYVPPLGVVRERVPIYRCGMMYGDDSTFKQFTPLAERAGRLLVEMPDEVRRKLPAGIGGEIPPLEDPARACLAIWLRTLHRLGWLQLPHANLIATRWHWQGVVTIEVVETPQVPEVHRALYESIKGRFYSALGHDHDTATSVPLASVWAIDAILDLAGPVEGAGAAAQADAGPADVVVEAPNLSEPSDEAFKAYRAYKFAGKKQDDIAEMLQTSQGQISRWVKQVSEWVEAGNMLPDLPGAPKTKAVDPSVLEMGKRQDGLTSRQRSRRSDD